MQKQKEKQKGKAFYAIGRDQSSNGTKNVLRGSSENLSATLSFGAGGHNNRFKKLKAAQS